jgi:hypothetical protein
MGKLAKRPVPQAVATAKGNRQSRLASLSAKATAAVGQRRSEFSSAADTARGKQLDAYGVKGKKKMEAALNAPEVKSAAAKADLKQRQLRTAKDRAKTLRGAYISELAKGSGEAGKVAGKDAKRYRMLEASKRSMMQQQGRDLNNLAYNTNSMGFKQSQLVRARADLTGRKLERNTALMQRLSNNKNASDLKSLPSARYVSARVRQPQNTKGRRYSNTNKASGRALTAGLPYYAPTKAGGRFSMRKEGSVNKIKTAAKPANGAIVRRPKPASKAPAAIAGPTGRTRSQAKAAQRSRREQTLDRGRTGVTGLGSMRKNPRIRRVQTGMSQLSLMGKAKPLVKFKPIAKGKR